MNLRTDLALEQQEMLNRNASGIKIERKKVGRAAVTTIRVTDAEGAKQINRDRGTYVTVELNSIWEQTSYGKDEIEAIAAEIKDLLPQQGTVLVCGLGNERITPDALGPKCADMILATRHIPARMQERLGLDCMRSVARIAPGVLGQNGMETGEILLGIIRHISPAVLVTVDALASRRLERLSCTVQICDTGITPGSGVGNARKEISPKTMGIPVISIGVPTVVDASTLACDLFGNNPQKQTEPNGKKMMVTPREIDLLIERAAKLVALAVNKALQPQIDSDDMAMLVGGA
ncbi:MAG TPA: GPR endopeptidase [Ruminococcaceae bacterium]|nr:GPR endopeptidase [Oscillospiraceae bacterium]